MLSLSAVSIDDRVVGGMGDGGRVGWDGEGWVVREVAKTILWDIPRAAMTPTQWPITHQ